MGRNLENCFLYGYGAYYQEERNVAIICNCCQTVSYFASDCDFEFHYFSEND